jgi:hypothetical protein
MFDQSIHVPVFRSCAEQINMPKHLIGLTSDPLALHRMHTLEGLKVSAC